MTDKRPWTEGPLTVKEGGSSWYIDRMVIDRRVGKSLVRGVAVAYSEADARLFAAAPQLYDVMEALLYDPYSMIRDSIRKKAEEVMLAANPAAFDGEGE